MGRILQLTPGYAISYRRLSPPLSSAELAVVRGELRRLEREQLPGPEDFEALLSQPAVGVAWARKIQGYALWVLYRISPLHVALHELTDRRPSVVDA